MLLPFQSKPAAASSKSEPLTEKQMADLAGSYTNNRQTIELSIKDGRLIARRTGGETSTSSPLAAAGENRLALLAGDSDDSSDRTRATYFIVRDASGRAEYLLSGSRAYKRK
jgi:hypothetical protein